MLFTAAVDEDVIFCGCKHTGTGPFCDGTHKQIGFDGTETASRERVEVGGGHSTRRNSEAGTGCGVSGGAPGSTREN